MIDEYELVTLIDHLEADALRRWIELGWIYPHQQVGGGARFDPSDVVRVRLICELHYELSIEEDSMSVVLSLMDQLYAVRRSMRMLVAAIEAEPDDVRARIARQVAGQR